jgi:hypothetical protein
MRDTIDMAREVDPVTKLLLDKKLPQGMDHDVFMWFLERFEALVRADERADCERVVGIALLGAEMDLAKRVLRAIRARGNT